MSKNEMSSLLNQAIVVFLLFILSSQAAVIRHKRGAASVGSVNNEKVIPPLKLLHNEAPAPDPGWTHCIKNLKANMFWRTLSSGKFFSSQPTHTQFQCSWFIEAPSKTYKVRVAFEKVKLTASAQCTETFLEVIDLNLRKSQGRFCGGKHIPDYVSSGHRLRIDIHGKEDLVNAIEKGEKPFILSYKSTTGSAGYRVNAPKPNKYDKTHTGTIDAKGISFTSKQPTSNVRGISVGDASGTGGQKIYGSSNNPIRTGKVNGGGSHVVYGEESKKSPLQIWHMVLIVIAGLLFIAIVAMFIIRRQRSKKEKEAEETKSSMEEDEIKAWKSSNSDDHEHKLITSISQKISLDKQISQSQKTPVIAEKPVVANSNLQIQYKSQPKPRPTQRSKKTTNTGIKSPRPLRTISRYAMPSRYTRTPHKEKSSKEPKKPKSTTKPSRHKSTEARKKKRSSTRKSTKPANPKNTKSSNRRKSPKSPRDKDAQSDTEIHRRHRSTKKSAEGMKKSSQSAVGSRKNRNHHKTDNSKVNKRKDPSRSTRDKTDKSKSNKTTHRPKASPKH